MPLFRLSESHISRPRSAVNAAAYRSGKLLEHNGKNYDYSWRDDVLHSEIILPENAPPEFADRQTLWSAAEKAEDRSTRRKEARTAHEILIAFPKELSFNSWLTMVKELSLKCFVSQGMIVDLGIHRGDRKDEEHPEAFHEDISPHNPHAHIMLTTRQVSREGFGKHKAREWESWDNAELLRGWRKEWADIQNRMFERKGLDYRVSHESSKNRNRRHIEKECEYSRGR